MFEHAAFSSVTEQDTIVSSLFRYCVNLLIPVYLTMDNFTGVDKIYTNPQKI